MEEDKGKKIKDAVTIVSASAGSLAGSVAADAAVNNMNQPGPAEPEGEEEVLVTHVDPSDDAEVVVWIESEPHVVSGEEYTDPGFIIEDVYAGPDPGFDPMDDDLEPPVVIYGPPEPDDFSDYYSDSDDL